MSRELRLRYTNYICMGILLCRPAGVRTSVVNCKVVMRGLDFAGKTTVLYKLSNQNETISTYQPTIGFNLETLSPISNVSFTICDVGGQKRKRLLWRNNFFQDCGAFVFVVDSSDGEHIDEAKEELHWILETDEMVGVPLVVMANKQDLPNAQSPSYVAGKLGLSGIKNRKWHVQGTSAVSGQGVYEAMEKLSTFVKETESDDN